ncbi:MAG TPA: crossover junction endodeoxyribonuclease RuvC [Alphaproteobacteria bacterium]|jgi:crossover junction endodeoxyribonuclease RuvC
MRVIGLDPGLRVTGWGVIEVVDNRLRHLGDGVVRSDADAPIAERLTALYDGLMAVIAQYAPDEAAIEETFVNRNASSTLKLGLARGVVLLAPAKAGLTVAEYAATLVKKSVVGGGHAAKDQVGAMIRILLPGCTLDMPDAADALAVAVCHAHHAESRRRLATVMPVVAKRAVGGQAKRASHGPAKRAPHDGARR